MLLINVYLRTQVAHRFPFSFETFDITLFDLTLLREMRNIKCYRRMSYYLPNLSSILGSFLLSIITMVKISLMQFLSIFNHSMKQNSL